MSSDNVSLLTYTSNINAGVTVYTEKVLLGQYISLSIIANADQNLTIIIQYSPDGTNWDYNVSHSYSVGANQVITGPVLAKWTRLQITNSSVTNTTHVRIYVYGTPTNSSISAQITRIGNFNPTVDIGNFPLGAFGELMVREDKPEIQYIFTHGLSGNMLTNTYRLPFTDITTWSTATSGLLGAPLTVSNGLVKFGNNFLQLDRGILQGSTFRYRPGQGLEAKFTAYFTQGLKNAGGNHPSTLYVGIGNSSSSSSYRPQNGYFFGYGDPSLVGTSQATNFGIVYINNGVRTFYPRTAWNVDRCDGTYQMPTIDFSKSNVFEIQYQYLGYGTVYFYVYNPSNGRPYLVHTINRSNTYAGGTATNLQDPSVGLVMFVEVEAGVIPASLTDEIGVGSFSLFCQGQEINPIERIAMENTKLGVTAETVLLSVRCDTTFYGILNWWPTDIDFISTASDGTKSVKIRIYRNCTLAGSVWVTPYQYICPVSYDVTGTISVAGTLLLSYWMAKVDKQQINLEDLHIHMKPGDIITITGYSTANNDIDCSVSAHVH